MYYIYEVDGFANNKNDYLLTILESAFVIRPTVVRPGVGVVVYVHRICSAVLCTQKVARLK